MKKRLIALLLAGTMTLSLAACGGPSEDPGSTASDSSESTQQSSTEESTQESSAPEETAPPADVSAFS